MIVSFGWLGVCIAIAATSCAGARPRGEIAYREVLSVPVKVGITAGPPVVGDLNGDGILDVVLPCKDSAAPERGHLAVFAGDGRGGFSVSHTSLPLPGDGLKVALGDVNNDGKLDAVVGQHDTYAVSVLLGDGRGGFNASPHRTITVPAGESPHTHAIALADVSADGNVDILTTCADDNAVAVLLGNGDGGFQPADGSPFPAGDHPYEGLSVGDVNGDRNPDVVVANLWGDSASILLGNGKGGLAHAAASPVELDRRPGFVALGDLNEDESLDLVATHDDDPIVTVLLGDGDGGMKSAPCSPVQLSQPVWSAVMVDADADGHRDIVLGGTVDRVFLLYGDGHGGLRVPPVSVRTGRRGSGYVASGDFNGDKKVDLIVAYFDGEAFDLFLGG